MKKKKIAIIGTGNMGRAIAQSIDPGEYEISCSVKSKESLKKLSEELRDAEVTTDNPEAVKEADIVILAVKPYFIREVIDEIRIHLKDGATLVSIIAGLTIDELEEMITLGPKRLEIFRVIPNTAIKFRESVTFISHKPDCPDSSVDIIKRIFQLSGQTFIVPEKELGACTSIASCGIAFFLRFIRAMAEGGVELGLKAGFATRIASLTARSAAAVLSDGSHPEAEIDKVTTPGGITIKGLNEMEAAGFTNAVISGLKATAKTGSKH